MVCSRCCPYQQAEIASAGHSRLSVLRSLLRPAGQICQYAWNRADSRSAEMPGTSPGTEPTFNSVHRDDGGPCRETLRQASMVVHQCREPCNAVILARPGSASCRAESRTGEASAVPSSCTSCHSTRTDEVSHNVRRIALDILGPQSNGQRNNRKLLIPACEYIPAKHTRNL